MIIEIPDTARLVRGLRIMWTKNQLNLEWPWSGLTLTTNAFYSVWHTTDNTNFFNLFSLKKFIKFKTFEICNVTRVPVKMFRIQFLNYI